MGVRREDLMGRKFGMLTVVAEAPKDSRFVQWVCDCDCGGNTVVRSNNLKTGNTRSCGCMKRNEVEPIRPLDPLVEQLRDIRRSRRMSISELAEKMGYSREQLRKIEIGECEPKFHFLICWVKALNLNIVMEPILKEGKK